MKKMLLLLIGLLLLVPTGFTQTEADYPLKKEREEPGEFSFIGYYLVRSEQTNISPKNTLFAGQVVGRLFGGNTTHTSDSIASFTEQRFMPMITYAPRVLNGWAKMRMSFEFDWTMGDKNYTTGGNVGGAFAADAVNMQTQNLFAEIHPSKYTWINIGLLRLYDNVRVPYLTPTDHLVYKGYRLAFFGSDATGISAHWAPDVRWFHKLGAYQLYENNTEQKDDVQLFEAATEYNLDVKNTIGFSLMYLRDRANGEGGIVGYGQGLTSALTGYNGTFRFALSDPYEADIFWIGTSFFGDPLATQGRFGYNGFAVLNYGKVTSASQDVDVMGYAANLRLAYKYGRTTNDFVAFDGIYTSGDDNGITDDTYSGVLTGNNWTSPGAVFFSHGLYLLMAHGTVVNRYVGATIDIQNMGYGLTAGVLSAAYDIVPNKLRIKSAVGMANSSVSVPGAGSLMGTEVNLNLRYSPKVFLDLELHAAYMTLGGFYDSATTNGVSNSESPDDPWTVFATLKWIMF
ncbi:hypothetical protein KQI63_16570 [bacterium]|nr:hypothetical protein [bacterium]